MGRAGASVRFDVVIVGARCAGAALAKHLADHGCSVALLDAAKLPSDQTTSTHLIQPPGMDELDALGLGDAVRRLSPALTTVRLAYDGREVSLPYAPGRAAHCLRRQALDPLLQRIAANAGAELRPETRVVDVLRAPDGRVCGVETRTRGAGGERIGADVVIGADGRNSTIAKAVDAEEYLGYDGPRSVYWAYWRRPPGWNPHELHNRFDGDDALVIFPTDGDLLLIASAPPLERARSWRSDHVAAYMANVRAHEPIGGHLEADEPLGEVRGVLRCRYFFRASAGPGWALIGDAGHHKEFVVGLGISDALGDAHAVVAALVDGGPLALQQWWRRRDIERIEMFHWARDLGRGEKVNALQRITAAELARHPELHGRFAEIIDGRRSPYGLVPPSCGARWAVAAAVHGDAAAFPPLLDAARRRARARRDLRIRSRLVRRERRAAATRACGGCDTLLSPPTTAAEPGSASKRRGGWA